jgi:hypothetical protein
MHRGCIAALGVRPVRGGGEMALTGRFNFRRSWFGKLMLEVEDEVKPLFGGEGKPLKRRWRRATLIDLAQPEMRPLIDLRFQPQFMARAPLRAVEPSQTVARVEDLPADVATLRRAETAPQRVSH